MIRTGDEYRESIRDGREVWINGERVEDVTDPPAFQPIVDVRARIYDMAHEAATPRRHDLRRPGSGERCAIGPKLPRDAGGLAGQAARRRHRAGRHRRRRHPRRRRDGRRDVVALRRPGRPERGRSRGSPRTSAPTSHRAGRCTTRSTSRPTPTRRATARSGRRTRTPTCCSTSSRETDGGIVVRGAKYETAAAYANQAFVKPTIGNWGDSELSDYAVGFIVEHGRARASSTSAGPASPAARRSRTTRSPTASTRSTPWSSSTTSRSPGRTSSSTATPGPPPTSAPRCTATAPSPSSSASCATPTC